MSAEELLKRSAEELRARAEAHQRLLERAVEGSGGSALSEGCALADCPHRRTLRQTLLDAVRVLEDTRKAFKSKRLEVLRKKLIGVLAEDA
jgi:hypothetical protein